MPHYLRIFCFLKGNNKYREGRIDGRSDIKWKKQLLVQLEVDMVRAEVFELFQS